MTGEVAAADELVAFDTARGRWVLAGMVLGSGVASLDATVVNVALPRLGSDLHADFAGLQWVLNGYTLTLASLILVGGALGDRLGRRKVFTIGVIWFAIASLLCGIAPNVNALIGARMLQGIGGALLTPGSLAILQASFRPEDRARAIGAWSGLGGVTTAIGPFLGGWLVDVASWRFIFLLNLPLAAVVVYVAARHVPESRDPTVTGRLDYTGAALGVVGLASTTYGLIERSWPIGAIGILALAAFLLVESRESHPMLPLGIFASRQFSAANVVTFFMYGGLAAALFLLGLVLQVGLGYSPLEAGVSLLPITVIMLVFSARAGALAQRIGPRMPMTLGPAVVAIGMLLMIRITPGASYASAVLPAVLVFAAGLALTVAPLTATVLAAADSRHSGVASGVNNAVARVGGLLAVAAVPLVAGINPAHDVAAKTLVSGFHTTMMATAGLVAIGAVLAFAFIRSDALGPPSASKEPDGGELEPYYHCGVGAPPATVNRASA